MPTRKDRIEPTELSPAESFNAPPRPVRPNDLQIICPGFALEVCEFPAGAPLQLEAQLVGGLSSDDFIFSWTLNPAAPSKCSAGLFQANGVVHGQTYQGGPKVALLTNGVEAADIDIAVTAELRAERVDECHPVLPQRGARRLRIREPKTADLKANFDQKMDQLVYTLRQGVSVNMQRSAIQPTTDLALWVVIRESSRALSFENYQKFMELVLCGQANPATSFGSGPAVYGGLRGLRSLPFNGADAYRLLKVATEAFLLVNGGVGGAPLNAFDFSNVDLTALNARFDGIQFDPATLAHWWHQYLVNVNGVADLTVPYLELIRGKLGDQPLIGEIFRGADPLGPAGPGTCQGLLRNKLSQPFLIELIWSYWHEEGMLVQTMNAISRRFQNFSDPRVDRDPLAALAIDPLRPLNNLLWGYIQDEQHRLSLVRRSAEYHQCYGYFLEGKAVPAYRPADSRPKFIEAFHRLLNLCAAFFKQDDDMTVRADGFPVLNALKEVHLLLAQGAHNQFGDLPSTARQEMLVQQFLLARPEFREFLPARLMVAYAEPWMDRVEAMKTLQGWPTDTSVQHFHNLAVYGEQLLLSIRYGAWNQPDILPAQAANWARFFRAEIKSYGFNYEAVTGVDLTSSRRVDSTPPSVHLRNRQARRA